MVEAKLPRIFNGEGATEAHATVDTQTLSAQQRQIDHFEEILVPADGDAIFGDPAEAKIAARIEIVIQHAKIADGTGCFGYITEQRLRQGLDLERIDPDHPETLVQ